MPAEDGDLEASRSQPQTPKSSQTRLASRLKTAEGLWETAPEYHQRCPNITADKFLQVSDLLLENPNLNSTHLFRADILYDSTQRLQTVTEKEKDFHVSRDDDGGDGDTQRDQSRDEIAVVPAPAIQGAVLERQVLRRLIPRKPQLDRPLDQSCYIYRLVEGSDAVSSGHVVVYVPDIKSEADVPWYHPPVKCLAYLYEEMGNDETCLSIHFLPWTPSSSWPLPTRLHRTFISLLHTFLRLAKNPGPEGLHDCNHNHTNTNTNINLGLDSLSLADISMAPSALKDTILPQHIVQNTYSGLKQRYAQDLISRWVEKTEPAKHVFEDLSIAAFVIELWKHMYPPSSADQFPGFVDIACGNGVLTYVLVKEGYKGRGFDARRRATWDVLGLDDHLDEMICVPKPFLDAVEDNEDNDDKDPILPAGTRVHDGLFPPGTFIISNHADELTPWTPLLAALSCPENPLPFLAIPCCSHALNGARNRYTLKDVTIGLPGPRPRAGPKQEQEEERDQDQEQPAQGDLKALRARKAKDATHSPESSSTYACLTKKVVSLALEARCDVELTLLRIPSTRNIGVVGNRRRKRIEETTTPTLSSSVEGDSGATATQTANAMPNGNGHETETETESADQVRRKIRAVIERECATTPSSSSSSSSRSGLPGAARAWISRARGLQDIGARRRMREASLGHS